jgi:DNA polymerase III delta prime subunit
MEKSNQLKKIEKLIVNSWVEKYRPKSIDELVLEDRIKKYLINIMSTGIIENMTLYGHAGTGKSSIVSVIQNTLQPIMLYVDGSIDTNVSNVREQVEPFCSSGRIDRTKLKLVVINESNRLSQNSFDAMKDMIEKSSSYCKFIFITNDLSPFPEPILSRCPDIYIKPPIKEMLGCIRKILDTEEVPYDKPSTVLQLVKRYHPDIRKCINECYNMFIAYGSINEEYLPKNSSSYNDIFDAVFKKGIKMRDIIDILKKSLYDGNEIYSAMADYFIYNHESSKAVIIVAEQISQSKSVFDKDLNLLSTILMLNDVVINQE